MSQEYTAFRDFASCAPESDSQSSATTGADSDSIQASLKIISDLQQESETTRAQIEALESKLASLSSQEDEYWSELNARELELSDEARVNDSLRASSLHMQQRIDALSSANVYDDVFRIRYDGQYATINGLSFFQQGRFATRTW